MGCNIYGQINPGNVDYTGKTTETVEVVVDNDARTIEANVLGSVGFDIRETLPRDSSGSFIAGTFTLTAIVVNNKVTFVWTSEGTQTPIRYGVTSDDPISGQTISGLSNGGYAPETKTFTFVQNYQKCVFAYPASWGNLSSIKHSETGLEVLSGFARSTAVVSGEEYKVYSSAKSTGTYTYIFTF